MFYAIEDIVMGIIRVELKELVLLCKSGIVKVFGLAGRDLLFQLNLTSLSLCEPQYKFLNSRVWILY
jgi:hypothetical protein